MSDAPTPDPMPDPSAAVPGPAQEVEVDLAAFLPEGVVLGEPDGAEGLEVDVIEAVIETDDGVVVVDEVVLAAQDGSVLVDEVIVSTEDGVVLADEFIVADEVAVAAAAEAPPAPAVDLEALSQIERDLDAVDAAIAALDAGTYGIDPATGQPIDDALLAEDPTRRS